MGRPIYNAWAIHSRFFIDEYENEEEKIPAAGS